jgi:hypothetical protein
MAGELFKKYYSRLAKEGLIKSILCGLIVGFSALFISSAVLWLTEAKLFWIAIIVFVVATAVAAPIFYYAKFKPTTKEIARRVDELGLEERVLTMTELEGDESFMAMRQREDAVKALSTVNASLLAVIVSVPLIVTTSVCGVFGAGMTTVTALSSAGVIKTGSEIIEEALAEPPVYVDIEYEVDGEGMVVDFKTEEEIPMQSVEVGKNAAPVLAVPAENWIFVGWSDEETDPYREDKNVTKKIVLVAMFAEMMDGAPGDGDGDGFPGDLPADIESDGNGNKPGKGPGAGGEYNPTNQIIDGQTFYGHEYDAAFEEVLEVISQSAEMPDKLKQLISNYFETIKTTTGDDNSSGTGGTGD